MGIMKLIVFTCFILVLSIPTYCQNTYVDEVEKFQRELNDEFLDPEESPLSKAERRKFKGHDFFPVNEMYRVEAEFIKADNPLTFQMKTSTSRLPTYDKYGKVRFVLDGQPYELSIYQSHTLRETDEYRDYLFLPFTDLTNGDQTYGGGRYIDLRIPGGNTIIIDFNKAYNPSCAYSHSYSCPIPPAENDLNIKIEAGIRNLEL